MSIFNRDGEAAESPGKLPRSADFEYLLWKRHAAPSAYHGSLPELIASDGLHVRRMISQQHHIAFQAFEDADTARKITSRIERSVSRGAALLGYAMFSDSDAVAIMHTGRGLEPGWLALPFPHQDARRLPTLPLRVAKLPKLRLVGGATLGWAKGELSLKIALEQRGSEFLDSPEAFNILEHIRSVRPVARVTHDGEGRELRLVSKKEDPPLERAGVFRLEAAFPVDDVIVREFGEDPSFRVWLVIRFDQELFCLPEDWLGFWLGVELEDKR